MRGGRARGKENSSARFLAPYDPVRDLAPVATATVGPNVLVVNNALPVKSVGGLIALARAKPVTRH